MIELPKKKVKASMQSPRVLVIFSLPKAGKSTSVSNLDDCLLVDLEKGTDFLDAMKVQANSWAELKEIIVKLKEVKKESGQNPYKYIAIDTISKLDEIVLDLAADLVRKSPMGSGFKGKGQDVLQMAHGAGYGFQRQAFLKVLDHFKDVTDRLILIGHVKDKNINKEGQDIVTKDISLTGKLGDIVAANADAIGFLFREKDTVKLNFKAGDELLAGARPEHLRGKVIELTSTDDKGKTVYHWDRVYID